MEVATSVLYLDASLEDGDFDDPTLGDRIARLAQRIARVRHGGTAEPLEPWMEELYRRVSDRQTMGSVVQELRSSLSEAEKAIDQFFRHPAERSVLIPVPGQLQAMRGVLSVLGLDHASHAVLRMREDVDSLIQNEVDPHHAREPRQSRSTAWPATSVRSASWSTCSACSRRWRSRCSCSTPIPDTSVRSSAAEAPACPASAASTLRRRRPWPRISWSMLNRWRRRLPRPTCRWSPCRAISSASRTRR